MYFCPYNPESSGGEFRVTLSHFKLASIANFRKKTAQLLLKNITSIMLTAGIRDMEPNVNEEYIMENPFCINDSSTFRGKLKSNGVLLTHDN
ncbi:hypothetical protein CEXT_527991 [Caerostris extrusa]|uniref:Uncharacterized protein n=1 Tax=Caerostris extrusa TaxID=172846 RepID=A0AAV4XAT2_CAEEX|nr:hypothetical protein CEXT_527991 [Caerostris extrusa]